MYLHFQVLATFHSFYVRWFNSSTLSSVICLSACGEMAAARLVQAIIHLAYQLNTNLINGANAHDRAEQTLESGC